MFLPSERRAITRSPTLVPVGPVTTSAPARSKTVAESWSRSPLRTSEAPRKESVSGPTRAPVAPPTPSTPSVPAASKTQFLLARPGTAARAAPGFAPPSRRSGPVKPLSPRQTRRKTRIPAEHRAAAAPLRRPQTLRRKVGTARSARCNLPRAQPQPQPDVPARYPPPDSSDPGPDHQNAATQAARQAP